MVAEINVLASAEVAPVAQSDSAITADEFWELSFPDETTE